MITVQFTPDLSAFQGVLISTDYVESFAKLTAKGGNEKKIDFVIDSIRSFLKRENYINDEGIIDVAYDTVRRFALYVVLNSNMPVLNELVNTDSSIDLLIWTAPTIPKYLMCEMLWKLCMGKFVNEIISFSCPQLAVEVADALISHTKYFKPTECLKELQMLSTGCFRMLCRIYFFDFNENLLQAACDNFHKCMMYFCNPPNEKYLKQLSKDNLYKHYGHCLNTVLTILQECFQIYNNTQFCDLDESITIYEISHKNDCTKKTDYKPCECSNKSILFVLKNCLTDILDKCRTLVMGINLDIFCAWSEFQEGSVTMQETIGELCYNVRQELCHSYASDHPVVSMLEQISRKPTNVEEIINTTDSAVIIENINTKNSASIQWLQALLHKDDLFEDLDLLQILDSNLDQFSESNCYELFQRLYDHVKACIKNKELMQSLTIKVYQRCSQTVKHEFVDNHFKDERFNNDLESTLFIDMLTVIFNKLAISPDADLTDILSVFVQNPRHVYVKIFKTAIENKQQMDLMFKVLTFLAKYSKHYYNEDTEPCFTIILQNTIDNELDTNIKQRNMINFVSMLKNAEMISGTKLLLLIIMPKLHTALVNKNIRDLNIHCNLLHKSYSVKDLLEYRAPMLAMLGQVMAQVRWKINTFDTLAPTTLIIVVDLQTRLMDTYNGNIPDNEASWLKSKLKGLNPLNMYYYRELWDPPGNTFVEVISGIHIHKNMDIDQLPLWLAQVLCSTSLQEWTRIWHSLKMFGDTKILEFFHHAMLSILKAEKPNRTNVTWACLLYCYKNLVHCIRYHYLEEPLSSSEVLSVTNKLLAIIGNIQEDYMEEFGAVVTPLFAYIAERKEDYEIDISQTLKSSLSHTKLSVIIAKLFCKGSV